MTETDYYYSILTSAAHEPGDYKVCAVCGNLAEAKARECPYCAGYRFDMERDHITNIALDQATHARTAVIDTALYEED